MRCVFMCRSRNGKTDMKQVRETRFWGNLCRQKEKAASTGQTSAMIKEESTIAWNLVLRSLLGQRESPNWKKGKFGGKVICIIEGKKFRDSCKGERNIGKRICGWDIARLWWAGSYGLARVRPSAYLWTRLIPVCDVLGTEVQTNGVGDKFILIFVNTSASINDAMNTVHLPRTTFSHAQLLRSLVAVLLSWCTVAHWSHAFAWLKSRSTVSAFRSKNTHISSLSCNVTFLFHFNQSSSELNNFCQDQRPQQSDVLTELLYFAGREPNLFVEDRDYRHFTGDGQSIENEDLRVRLLFFHLSMIASTYDSAESIATPLESDFEEEQFRALLYSPRYLQEREAIAERSQVFHSERAKLISSSSQDPLSTWKFVALFSSENRLNQDTFSEREEIFFKTSTGYCE